MKVTTIALCLFGSLVSLNAHAGWFGPSNFDECILASMKGVTSDIAAHSIRKSCRSKFAEEAPDDVAVPPWVKSNLDGLASASDGYFRGSIHNGNADWTITQITITLIPDKATAQAKSLKPKSYNINITIRPLSDASILEKIDSRYGDNVEWDIATVRGHQSAKR